MNYTGNLPWIKDRTILYTRAGSRAYGTHTEDSDYDYKGICIPPEEYRLGFLKHFEQTDFKPHENAEATIFDIQKYFKLATDANPNILELLWTEDEDVIEIDKCGELLRKNRELFLSKKVLHTYRGYAMSQLKRVETHRRWLLTPPDHQPTRKEYDIERERGISSEQIAAALTAIKNKMDSWQIDFGELDEASKIYINEQVQNYLLDIDLEQKFRTAGASLGFDNNFIEYLNKEREYKQALANYKQYEEWKKNRNPKRAELEAKYGYDCYSDDTEFLTENGWRLFKDIQEDEKLATVCLELNEKGESLTQRKYLSVEYQNYTDKFSGTYSGPMYHFSGNHVDTLVTPNHRMLAARVEKNTGKKYSLELTEAAHLTNCFDFLIAPNPKIKAYSYKELFKDLPIPLDSLLKLMGWYLSDGSMIIKNGKIKSIVISQKEGGRLSEAMQKWHSTKKDLANSSIYSYIHTANSYRKTQTTEKILSVRNKQIIDIIAECGRVKEKHVPRWVFGLSKRMMEMLLDAMIGGDGTYRSHKTKSESIIYYSSVKRLADDVQELALLCGFETSLYGPYEYIKNEKPSLMYQVHIRKIDCNTKNLNRFQNIEKIESVNQNIVCFTVPNGTLITRRNGHIAIHGNSKHANHLKRLMKTCREILTEGKIYVRRPDAEDLKAVRNGKYTYEEIVAWAKKEDEDLIKVAQESKLPHSPDKNKLDALCVKIIKMKE